MANSTKSAVAETEKTAAAPASPSMSVIAPAIAWLIPGAGHLIQRRWIRPSHDLMLQLRIAQRVEEFAKAVDQIGLGDDDENRKAHAQYPLNTVELLGNFPGLALDGIGGVADQ